MDLVECCGGRIVSCLYLLVPAFNNNHQLNSSSYSASLCCTYVYHLFRAHIYGHMKYKKYWNNTFNTVWPTRLYRCENTAGAK